ncbi:MAG: universal stress protein [Thermodesulfobacteriota bacterium]
MAQVQDCCLALYNSVLVAVDGSKFSELALDEGINIAKACKSRLFVINVIDTNEEFMALAPDLEDLIEDKAKELLDKSRDKAAAQDVNCETIVHFDYQTYRPIIKEAQERKISLIIVGSHGHSALERTMMGSVSLRVVAHSPCPVLVIPAGF